MLSSLLFLATVLEPGAPEFGRGGFVDTIGADPESASHAAGTLVVHQLPPRRVERSPTLGYGDASLQRLGLVGACGIRVIAVPSPDGSMVRSVHADQLDRIVRDDLAACAR